jgi:hypothetical protein
MEMSWVEWPRFRWPFYSSGEWKSCGLGRMADGGGANLMLRFRLEMGGNGIKHYRKTKRRPWAHFDSMERKCDTTQHCGDVDQRRGGAREETMPVGLTWIHTEPKNEEYSRGQFSCYKMVGEDLKQRLVNLIFFWKYVQVRSSFIRLIA